MGKGSSFNGIIGLILSVSKLSQKAASSEVEKRESRGFFGGTLPYNELTNVLERCIFINWIISIVC
jgi:hypothetical protein